MLHAIGKIYVLAETIHKQEVLCIVELYLTMHKYAKHGRGRQEVPDVMIVIEIQQDTVLVQLTRLRWHFLK